MCYIFVNEAEDNCAIKTGENSAVNKSEELVRQTTGQYIQYKIFYDDSGLIVPISRTYT